MKRFYQNLSPSLVLVTALVFFIDETNTEEDFFFKEFVSLQMKERKWRRIYLQLSNSIGQRCSSNGNFVKSIKHVNFPVTLKY